MRNRSFVGLLALATALAAGPVFAQHAHDHAAPAASKAGRPAPSSVLAEGEVRKVDRVRGVITLRHGPLEALGMGPMTMPFVATDPKLLAGVKEGDRVRFVPGEKDGTLTVSRIEVVR